MEPDSLQNLLDGEVADLAVSGHDLHFSLDLDRSPDLLAAHQLPDPSFWILKLVQAAVSARSAEFKVFHRDGLQVCFGGRLSWEPLRRALGDLSEPAEPWVRHLRLALWTLALHQRRDLTLSLRDEPGRLVWKEGQPRFEEAPRSWLNTLSVAEITRDGVEMYDEPLLALLNERAAHAPLEIICLQHMVGLDPRPLTWLLATGVAPGAGCYARIGNPTPESLAPSFPGSVCWLLDGVVVEEEPLSWASGRLSLQFLLPVDQLRTDLSGFTLVDTEATRETREREIARLLPGRERLEELLAAHYGRAKKRHRNRGGVLLAGGAGLLVTGFMLGGLLVVGGLINLAASRGVDWEMLQVDLDRYGRMADAGSGASAGAGAG